MKPRVHDTAKLGQQNSAQAAGERFFRRYHKHTVTPGVDTLFELLNAMHSFNDRLKKTTDRDFLDLDEFVALKALRNVFHHQEEVLHKVKIISAQDLPPISSDLLFLCLVPTTLVNFAIEMVPSKFRAQTEEAMRRAFRWYGSVVNVNPCLFNLAVRTHERLQELDIKLSGAEHEEFEASYRAEEAAGQSHLVTGRIYCHAGSVEEVLAEVFGEST